MKEQVRVKAAEFCNTLVPQGLQSKGRANSFTNSGIATWGQGEAEYPLDSEKLAKNWDTVTWLKLLKEW